MARTTSRPLTLVALLLATFMAAMEATVVATAMPTVIADLGGVAHYAWVGSAYLLASTVSVPLFGKLSDISGRRPVLLFGLALFLLGSIASGAAPSIELLIAARTVQGLGAGVIQPVSLTVLGDLYRVEERGRVQGLFGAVWGVSGVAGPLLGGFIVHRFSWPWVFWVNVPFGLAAGVFLLTSYREEPRAPSTLALDWQGALVLTLASCALLLGAGGTLVPLTLGGAALLFALFVAIERRAAAPVLPLPLLRERHIAVAVLSGALTGAAMMTSLTFLPLHVQGVLGGTPSDAGKVITPMLLGWPITSALSTRFIVRGGYRRPIVGGSLLIAVALVGLAFAVGQGASVPWIGSAMFVFGCGMGLTTAALIIGLQASVTIHARGVVTALSMFSRTMGGALGVGALGALFAASLAARLDPERVATLLSPERGAVVRDASVSVALAESFGPLFWALAACGLVNAAVVLFYPRHVLRAEPAPAPAA
jgi:EmrB/QacA subfamily drug resistance transporter